MNNELSFALAAGTAVSALNCRSDLICVPESIGSGNSFSQSSSVTTVIEDDVP